MGHPLAARQAATGQAFRIAFTHDGQACAAAKLALGVLAGWIPQVDRACVATGRGHRRRPLRSRLPTRDARLRHEPQGHRERRGHRDRHRQVRVPPQPQRDPHHRCHHARRSRISARRQTRVVAPGSRRIFRCRRRDHGEFRERDREGHARATRRRARGREGRRQTFPRSAPVAAVYAALLFLRRRRCAARVAHDRVRRRRRARFHPRHRPAFFSAAQRCVTRPAHPLRGGERGPVRRSGARPHRTAA